MKINVNLFFARLVLLSHVLLMIMFWVGAIASFKWNAYAPYHLAIVVFVVVLNKTMGTCVLTELEHKFLVRAGRKKYGHSCYGYYLFENVFGYTPRPGEITRFLIIVKVIPGLMPLLLYIPR